MRNLEVLSLSVNKCVARARRRRAPSRAKRLNQRPSAARRISTLRDLAGCAALQELYLRKNEVAELAEVRHLRHCHALRVLWLCDNPCAAAPDYRARCVRRCAAARVRGGAARRAGVSRRVRRWLQTQI